MSPPGVEPTTFRLACNAVLQQIAESDLNIIVIYAAIYIADSCHT